MKYPVQICTGYLMDRYLGKYRIESTRAPNWDYGSPGSYFITICTKNRSFFFGEIIDKKMYLNEIGLIADSCWLDIPRHFKNIRLGEHVVMPNHVHGIIIIDEPGGVRGNEPGNVHGNVFVEKGHGLSLRKPTQNGNFKKPHPRFQNPGKNTISTMVGSYKSAVTKLCRPINPLFGWQSGFYDHVIRKARGFDAIARYIRNNPAKWKPKLFR